MLRSRKNPATNRHWCLVTCVLILSATPTVQAQTVGQPPTSVPESWRDDADLHDIHFVDSDYGWAVGDHGTIWHTQNGGQIWRRQSSTSRAQLCSVHFIDRQTGWVAGGSAKPLIPSSRGLLLRTVDGGRTWEETDGLLLPWLNTIHFSTRNKGVAAGHASTMYPTGAWTTNDGGRTWSPIAGVRGTHWLKSDVQTNNGGSSGLLLGHNRQLARLENKRLSVVPTQSKDWSRDSFLCGINSSVYFSGLPLLSLTVDGGRNWQTVGNFSPPGVQRNMQLSTMVRNGKHCWLAGSPGNHVLRSEDDGRTWKTNVAPSSLPLAGLHFISSLHGWAIGARGTILSTTDGGTTWKRQRAGMKRDAIVGIFADERDIPWQLLAQSSAVDELRTHIVLIATAQDSSRSPIAQRVQYAAMQIGATAEVLTTAHLSNDLSPQALIDHWEMQQANATDWLVERLTRIIRERRPDVVLASEWSHDKLKRGSQRVTSQLVADACEYAANDQAFTEQHEQLGLGVWNVSRALRCSMKKGVARMPPSKRTTATGETPEDLALAAERVVYGAVSSRPAWTLQSLRKSNNQADMGSQLFAGLVVEYDSAARRARAPTSNSAATTRRLAAALSQMHSKGLQRIEKIESLAKPSHAGQMLFDLAASESDPAERDILLGQFIARHENHPLTDAAAQQLIHRYTSLERLWKDYTENQVIPAAAVLAEVPAGGGSGDKPTVQLVSAETEAFHADWNPALKLLQHVKSKRPGLYVEPEIAFALSSVLRLDKPNGANSILKQQMRLPTYWQQLAQSELRLAGSDRTTDQKLTAWACKSSENRPLLDGDFGDEIWQTAEFKPLTSGNLASSPKLPPTLVGIAKDTEFLYFAAYCPKRPGIQYLPIRKKRPRDAELSGQDRVQLNIDINRDYQSWWTLAFDNRGWTFDAMNEDSTWNPKYYVASKSDDKVWAIEAAIPLDQLAPDEYRDNAYWAIGTQRMVPGMPPERWHATNGADIPPHLQGIMHVE